MGFSISRREVLNNLIRFKDSLLEKKAKKTAKRTYKVLINRKTGDMRFPQKIESLEYRIHQKKGKGEIAGEWKVALIIVTEQFDLQNENHEKIEPTEFDPLAWRIIRETLEALNEKAKETKGERPLEEEVLEDLSTIQLASFVERLEDFPAWVGFLQREAAEKRLHGKKEGTYLLREGDPITLAIGFHLAKENHCAIHLYLLTVVEEGEKISDLLLIQTSKGWTQYQDDPNLNDSILYQYQPNPQILLQHLNSIAKEPISRGVQ